MFRVESIFQNVHWLPGSMPSDVWRHPDVANAFIFEHNSDVYLVDSGVGPAFRQALSRFFAAKHYDSATLINTHMHTDHVCNNDLLNEINASEKHHLIHPAGIPDPYEWIKSEFRLAARDYYPFNFDVLPQNLISAFGRILEKVSPETAYSMFAVLGMRKFEPIYSQTPYLTPLSSNDLVALRIGSLEFKGWHAGELLLLDDRGHSPDTIAVYDPIHKILLLGDLTYEYNPLWPSGTYQRMIENLKKYRELASAGEVSMLADGHNHRLFNGANEILPLLDNLIATHERRRVVIVKIAKQLNTNSIESIRSALVAEDAEFAQMAREKEFPREICFTRAMIAVALRESMA